MATRTNPYFSRSTIRFLRDLSENNERAWFKENKDRYEKTVKDPAIQFILDFAPHLKRISPHFRADPRPVGGSLFRIYRDTRFSKDKTPYKTHVGVHFRHERAKDAHAPGFYLHIEPKDCFIGAGIWHPDSATTRRIRDRIVEDPAGWKRASRGKKFTDAFELVGDSLVRNPKGFDPDHPLIEDLKRKDFIGLAKLPMKAATGPDLLSEFTGLCRSAGGYVKWLCGALDVEF